MSDQHSYYVKNRAYADFLESWDESFYAKYADALAQAPPGSRVLDVGCGVGQVLKRLQEAGLEAHGVEVSEPNIEKAKRFCSHCLVYDGLHLPFPDAHFAGAGALNVLEHVEQPEAVIHEIVRVTQPGGRIVLSSPNFFRVLGFRDYHHRMRGFKNKWQNAQRLAHKRRQIQLHPHQVRFDKMEPVIKEPFTPDDDAIVATNPLEMAFFLKQAGCRIESVECTDRYVNKLLDRVLNATFTRYLMFNSFVIAQKNT